MLRDEIQYILRHWCLRQEQLGPESAFGFRLVMGPKKTRILAKYANTLAPKTKTREKGKQREVQLDGLLPISQNETPNPSGSPINDPSPNGAEIQGMRPSPSDELVRIDMGQMIKLKNMGLQIMGPVNGPNEGFPQYEVPRHWLQELETEPLNNSESASGPSTIRPYPHPRPITKKSPPQVMQPVIDPTLINQAQEPIELANEQHQEILIPDVTDIFDVQSGSGPVIDSTNNAATVLGKRSTIIRSPPRSTQAKNSQRRKVVTGDDLAYQEAQELLKGGVTKRSRKKNKKIGF